MKALWISPAWQRIWAYQNDGIPCFVRQWPCKRSNRQRVVDYAREKNYVPNMMAKSLVTKKSYNVALVFSRQFSNFEGQFLRKTITAVCDVMARNDYDVLLAMVGEQEAQPCNACWSTTRSMASSWPARWSVTPDPIAAAKQTALYRHRPPRLTPRCFTSTTTRWAAAVR